MQSRRFGEFWRYLPPQTADGFTQMAIDESLLRISRSPVVRFYTWQPWAISLGYHQSADVLDLPAIEAAGIDVVRRPTGGRAVLHARELTYAVIVPASGAPAPPTGNTVYRLISTAIGAGLSRLGIPVDAEKPTTPAARNYMRSPLCFASRMRSEIAVTGKKLVGSAQRRFAEGILQHGSILLGREHEGLSRFLRTPLGEDRALVLIKQRAISISEIMRSVPPMEELIAALKNAFAAVFQCQLRDSGLTTEEQEGAYRTALRLRQEFQNQRAPAKQGGPAGARENLPAQ